MNQPKSVALNCTADTRDYLLSHLKYNATELLAA